jgi:hypothetical protein
MSLPPLKKITFFLLLLFSSFVSISIPPSSSFCSTTAFAYLFFRWEILFASSLFTPPFILPKIRFKIILLISYTDALPSHGVKPTWGFHKVKLRKVETWRHALGFQL